MKSVEMTAAFKHSPTHTQVTFRFPVQREYLNPGGTLHGAAQSLFFDVCTTWLLGPIARKPDYWCSFGTSRSLNVVYLRPAREGDVLTLECEVSFGVFISCLFRLLSFWQWLVLQITNLEIFWTLQTVNVGKRLALLKGVLKREDGALISTCEHQMYNVDADAAAAKL
jgi:acyl-coenzyme A thioesterase 13